MDQHIPNEIPVLCDVSRSDEALGLSEARFRALAESAADAIVTIDLDSRILFVNRAAEKIFGYAEREMLGHEITMLMPEYLRHVHKSAISRYNETGRRHIDWARVQLPGLHKDGHEIPVELSIAEHMEGEKKLFTGVLRDISERVKSEEALRNLSGRLLRSQDDERRRIGRELHDSAGQYLVALKMNLDTLAARLGQSTCDPYIRDKLSESVDLTDRCVTEIRTLSYLLHPPLLEDAGLAETVRWYVEGFAKRSGISVTVEIDPDLKRLGANAELALFRIVQESLTNIHRHSGSETASVRIAPSGNALTIEIVDKGQGMSREVVAKLGGSAGVGIAGMRERLSELHGTFQINSDANGTVVRASIPVDRV